MKDVKNKFFAPYMIISFVLFLASFFLSMTSELIKTNLDIFVLIGFGFSLLFTILMEARIKTDKIYSIIFVLLMIIAEVFFGLLDKALLGSIFFILSFTSFLIRLINEYDNHKLAFYIGVSLISISSIIVCD